MWQLDGPGNRTHVFTETRLFPPPQKKKKIFKITDGLAGSSHGGMTITSGVQELSQPNSRNQVMGRRSRHISALCLIVTNNSDTYILNMKVQGIVVPIHIGEAEV